MQRFVSHLNNYFAELIEIVVAAVLMIWGFITLLPVELFPGSIYVYNLAKIPFGIVLSAPGVYLIVLRLRHEIKEYIKLRVKRRQSLFFISVGLIYLSVLSAAANPWPPRFLLFLAQALISTFCYLRLIRQ